jgi:hypothetical protein
VSTWPAELSRVAGTYYNIKGSILFSAQAHVAYIHVFMVKTGRCEIHTSEGT